MKLVNPGQSKRVDQEIRQLHTANQPTAPGLFHGIWSNMYIEAIFMRREQGMCSIIGITLKPEVLKI